MHRQSMSDNAWTRVTQQSAETFHCLGTPVVTMPHLRHDFMLSFLNQSLERMQCPKP